MDIKQNILETIGNTPLIQLNKITKDLPCLVAAKVDYFNPGNSIKDRMAVKMIEVAEKEGKLKPGGTIIEGTSGNTGMGLAIAKGIVEAHGEKIWVESEPGQGAVFYARSHELPQRGHCGGAVQQVAPEHPQRRRRGESASVDTRAAVRPYQNLQQRDSTRDRINAGHPQRNVAAQVPGLARPGGQQVTRYAIQEKQVGGRREQVAHQPLAVSPGPVDLPPGTPSVALPALECDARHPSAALANGRTEVPRKVLACRRR